MGRPVLRAPKPESDAVKGTETDASVDAPLSAWQFRLAVLRHQRIVFRVSNALLRDRHEAEDVTQDAFLRYWQRGAHVKHPREWLLRVARNACLDRLRIAGRWVADASEAALEVPDDHDPAWHYQRRELAAQLDRLIDALPEPQRSLVVLFDVHGVKGDACARILGISVNQVKVYLHRARRRLRLNLERSS